MFTVYNGIYYTVISVIGIDFLLFSVAWHALLKIYRLLRGKHTHNALNNTLLTL
jgi:hypothetical protein